MATMLLPAEQMIDEWTQIHNLIPTELNRLRSIITDFGPEEVSGELDEELKAILAARSASLHVPLTREQLLRAKENSRNAERFRHIPND